ncbi:hypothetical protein [Bacillus velezensis]|nr:hypothetical protein [Bacillus velezensis]MEC1924763.1 hypothetical protein [Bacillus velezensis]ULN61295.1 hypothetical protein MID02_02245 [Bacillus velezensis]UYQ96711.1 hypothetical protein NYR93_12770 [Bacillus velezensis]WDV42635.1 hypothetical protein PVT72_02245 [Bacillus velezensis]
MNPLRSLEDGDRNRKYIVLKSPETVKEVVKFAAGERWLIKKLVMDQRGFI